MRTCSTVGWSWPCSTTRPCSSQAVSKLEAAGIPYKVKDQSIGPKDRRTGSLGGSSRFNTLFQISVKKEDLDRARYALR